jgi:hypothetical protein
VPGASQANAIAGGKNVSIVSEVDAFSSISVVLAHVGCAPGGARLLPYSLGRVSALRARSQGALFCRLLT